MSEAKCSIYVLVDPLTGKPRYVGKAINPQRRFRQHCSLASNTKVNLRSRWLAKLIMEGRKPEIVILQTEVSDWDEAERFWVRYYRNRGLELVNGNDGGKSMEHTQSCPKSNRSRGRRTAVAEHLSTIKRTLNRVKRGGDAVKIAHAKARYFSVVQKIAELRKAGTYDAFVERYERHTIERNIARG